MEHFKFCALPNILELELYRHLKHYFQFQKQVQRTSSFPNLNNFRVIFKNNTILTVHTLQSRYELIVLKLQIGTLVPSRAIEIYETPS